MSLQWPRMEKTSRPTFTSGILNPKGNNGTKANEGKEEDKKKEIRGSTLFWGWLKSLTHSDAGLSDFDSGMIIGDRRLVRVFQNLLI